MLFTLHPPAPLEEGVSSPPPGWWGLGGDSAAGRAKGQPEVWWISFLGEGSFPMMHHAGLRTCPSEWGSPFLLLSRLSDGGKQQTPRKPQWPGHKRALGVLGKKAEKSVTVSTASFELPLGLWTSLTLNRDSQTPGSACPCRGRLGAHTLAVGAAAAVRCGAWPITHGCGPCLPRAGVGRGGGITCLACLRFCPPERRPPGTQPVDRAAGVYSPWVFFLKHCTAERPRHTGFPAVCRVLASQTVVAPWTSSEASLGAC